jgi:hypothetical protein
MAHRVQFYNDHSSVVCIVKIECIKSKCPHPTNKQKELFSAIESSTSDGYVKVKINDEFNANSMKFLFELMCNDNYQIHKKNFVDIYEIAQSYDFYFFTIELLKSLDNYTMFDLLDILQNDIPRYNDTYKIILERTLNMIPKLHQAPFLNTRDNDFLPHICKHMIYATLFLIINEIPLRFNNVYYSNIESTLLSLCCTWFYVHYPFVGDKKVKFDDPRFNEKREELLNNSICDAFTSCFSKLRHTLLTLDDIKNVMSLRFYPLISPNVAQLCDRTRLAGQIPYEPVRRENCLTFESLKEYNDKKQTLCVQDCHGKWFPANIVNIMENGDITDSKKTIQI